MNVKQATKALEDRKAHLSDLTEQSASLSRELERLQEERNAAVRSFSAGDNSKRALIRELDKKIEPFGLRFEGTRIRIAEAQTAVEEAATAQDKACNDEHAAIEAFIAEKRAERIEVLLTGLPVRLQKIFGLYLELSKEMGQLEIDSFRYEKWSSKSKLLELTNSLGYRIFDMQQQEIKKGNVCGFAPYRLSLLVNSLAVPIDRLRPNVAGCRFLDLVNEANQQEITALTEAFHEQKGGENDG